jgi:hypothetical protein
MMIIIIFLLAFIGGFLLGCSVHRHLFAGLVMKKMEAAAEAIQPVVVLDNEFAKGARIAARAIFAEFGIGYKDASDA